MKKKLCHTFFRLNKALILEKRWAKLSLASKAVLPSIGIFCNPSGLAFPSQQLIAEISGLSLKSVRAGIQGLEDLPGFKTTQRTTARGYKATKYLLQLPPKTENQSVFLHRPLFDNGLWAKISLGGKALYPVIRAFSYFHDELYSEMTGHTYFFDEKDFPPTDTHSDDEIPMICRSADFFSPNISRYSKYVGMGRTATRRAFRDLINNGLIREVTLYGEKHWAVYILPPEGT